MICHSDMNRIIDTIQSYYGIDDISAKVRKYPYPSAKMAAILLLPYTGCSWNKIARLVGMSESVVTSKWECFNKLLMTTKFNKEYADICDMLKADQ